MSEDTEAHEVNNTPFVVVRLKDEWAVLFGKYQIEIGIKTMDEAVAEARRFTWTNIMKVIMIIVDESTKKEE